MSRLLTVLVVGGTGYVGSNLVHHLKSNPAVRVLVGTRCRAVDGVDSEGTRTVDLINDNDEDALVHSLAGCDVVVNCVGASAADCRANPANAVRTNVLGASKLLAAAAKAELNTFIQLSSIHVYGDRQHVEVNEQSPTLPTSTYGAIHLSSELVLRNSEHEGVSLVVLRLSNAFGGLLGERSSTLGLVVNDLCRQSILKREMIVKSSGNQFRDFIPMDWVVRGIEHFCVRNIESENNELFNLCLGDSLRVRELAFRIAEHCDSEFGFTPTVRFESVEPRESERFTYSNSKLISSGFVMNGALDDGIVDCLRYCQMQRVRGVANWID